MTTNWWKPKEIKVTVFQNAMPCSLVNSSTLHGVTSQKTIFFSNYCLYLRYFHFFYQILYLFIYLPCLVCSSSCVVFHVIKSPYLEHRHPFMKQSNSLSGKQKVLYLYTAVLYLDVQIFNLLWGIRECEKRMWRWLFYPETYGWIEVCS